MWPHGRNEEVTAPGSTAGDLAVEDPGENTASIAAHGLRDEQPGTDWARPAQSSSAAYDGLAVDDTEPASMGRAGGGTGQSLTVRLVAPGHRPVAVLDVLAGMGCPPNLAAEYVGASVEGSQPEVLSGASSGDANQVAEALRKAGATVSVGPSDGPSVILSNPPPAVTAEKPLPGERLREVDVVERYLAAYDAGDKGRLVLCLSATAVLSDATGAVLVQGAEGIGRRMAEIFGHYPDRRVTVMGRQVAGPWVIDHHLTTFSGGSSEETVMCYRVEGGLIERLVLLV